MISNIMGERMDPCVVTDEFMEAHSFLQAAAVLNHKMLTKVRILVSRH
jgi:hypothetical protein